MSEEEVYYLKTGRAVSGAVESQMFGKPCFKINGKAFISFFNNCMVFKIDGTVREKALSLPGSVLFDPSGKGRPMKEWVQVTYENKEKWPEFAEAAFTKVKS